MIQYMLSLSVCAINNIEINGACTQLYKDVSGTFYYEQTVKKYIMCAQNYILVGSLCNGVIDDPNIVMAKQNINRDGNIFSAIQSPLQQCAVCTSGLVLDFETKQCVPVKTVPFSQITCNGFLTVASDLAGTNFDQISLCALSSDPSLAVNSIITFDTTLTINQSTAIGLFSQTTIFSNMIINGILNIKQSKSSSQVYIGTLIGLLNVNINVQNCSINIKMKLDSSSVQTVFKSGGLVGMVQGQYILEVKNCSVTVQVDLINQNDNDSKRWYSVSGGIVGHLHLVPTVSVENSTTTCTVSTTRSAGGILGLLQGGIVALFNSTCKGTAKALACGGIIGEANAPGLNPSQKQQITIDTATTTIQLTGTYMGGAIGQMCKMTVILFQGTNSIKTNGKCPVGNANGGTFSGATSC
ncbi:Hypothetical_protein [Hexamita inflata]|uniref:Hypothetical_protein n=1 Tax=Hexamita inflata TaxID=28002 RepID=A0ABP1IK41_9EUKA